MDSKFLRESGASHDSEENLPANHVWQFWASGRGCIGPAFTPLSWVFIGSCRERGSARRGTMSCVPMVVSLWNEANNVEGSAHRVTVIQSNLAHEVKRRVVRGAVCEQAHVIYENDV